MKRFFPLLFLLACFSLDSVFADWPRFRGPNGSGVIDGSELPVRFDESTTAWSVEVPGVGHGSPAIYGGRLFLLSAVEAEEETAAPERGKGRKGRRATACEWLALCLDARSGEMLWSKRFPQGKFKGHRFNSAASSTPAVDSDQVVFAWGTADQLTVVSLDHEGALQWEQDLGPVVGGHGFGGSPILHEDLVVLNNDQEKRNGNLIGLEAATGAPRWIAERRSERISYSAPCVYEADGRTSLVFTNWQHGFTAIDPADGSVIAEKSVFNTDTNERAISSPIVADGLVIGTCGFTANPKHCVAMRLAGGEWEEVWRIERNVPHIPSVIAVGEHTFLIDDSGIGTCAVTATGQVNWRERIPGVEGSIFGSPVSDGKNLFFPDESGNLHVIAASAEFTPVASTALGEGCRTTPAIVDGTLYVRTESKLTAYR